MEMIPGKLTFWQSRIVAGGIALIAGLIAFTVLVTLVFWVINPTLGPPTSLQNAPVQYQSCVGSPFFSVIIPLILILVGLYLLIREIQKWRQERAAEKARVTADYKAMMEEKGFHFDDRDPPSTEMMQRRIDREKYWATEIAFDCPKDGKRRTIDECFREGECSNYFYREEPGGRGAAVIYCMLNRRELKSGDRVP